jgi:uncharacterized DUF497 family protein
MIRLTKHAQDAISVRGIAFAWIEEVVSSADFVEADPRHPERTRSYKAIAEFGSRVLRVVHRPEGDDIVIITVHFDRGAR